MKYKIGVFGSAVDENKETQEKAKNLAYELAKHNVILITGACSGTPYLIAYEAAKKGIEVWGYSPEVDFRSQKKAYEKDDIRIYKKLFYIPANYRQLFFLTSKDKFESDRLARLKFRNVISTANCDAGIIISGRWGTMNEFTNLYDMGKVIGVFTGTGGIADELEKLMNKITKKSKAFVIFDSSPKSLLKKIINSLKTYDLSRKTG